MEQVFGEQLDAAPEVLGERLQREIRARARFRADRVERLPEGDAVEPLRAVGEELRQDLRNPSLPAGTCSSGRFLTWP